MEVRLGDVVAAIGGKYESPNEYKYKTSADGRWHAEQFARQGHDLDSQAGLLSSGPGPTDQHAGKWYRAAHVQISSTSRYGGFRRIRTACGVYRGARTGRGNVVGSWGGSGNIDKENQITFKDAPPGRDPRCADIRTRPPIRTVASRSRLI